MADSKWVWTPVDFIIVLLTVSVCSVIFFPMTLYLVKGSLPPSDATRSGAVIQVVETFVTIITMYVGYMMRVSVGRILGKEDNDKTSEDI